MLSRKFTPKEKILLIILGILLVICVYLMVVQKTVREGKWDAKSRIDTASAQLEIETMRAGEISRMQERLDEAKKNSDISPLADYNNIKNVVSVLNNILSQTISYDLAFEEVEFEGYLAKRTIQMSFKCDGLKTVKKIIADLENSPYYCQVIGVNIGAGGGSYYSYNRNNADITKDTVTAQMTLVFFEYTGGQEAGK